ncbi:hypothetical protein CFP56_032034 [Quercus suber]|uniref:Uncharacterized protein n=1 Tax=Quercus suber TaxID=58331 RepID=A0AAW0JIW2_QUESU
MGIGNTSTYDTLVKNTRMEESVGIGNMTRKNGYRRTSCVSANEWVFVKCSGESSDEEKDSAKKELIEFENYDLRNRVVSRW